MAMNSRVFIAGVIGGIVAALALVLPLLVVLPGYYASEWPVTSSSTATLGYALAVVVALTTGYGAARWGWAVSVTECLRYGAVAGAATGLLAFSLVGAGAAGVASHAPLFQHGARPAASDREFNLLLCEPIIRLFWFTHVTFYSMCLAGLLLGALGGMVCRWHGAAGWGNTPRSIHQSIWMAVSMTTLVYAALDLAISTEVLVVMAQRLERTVATYRFTPSFAPEGVFSWGVSMPLAVLTAAGYWNWRWVVGWSHPERKLRSRARYAGVLILLLPLAIMALLGQLDPTIYRRPIMAVGALILLAVTLVNGFNALQGPRAVATPEPATRTTFRDWLDFLLPAWLIMLATETTLVACGMSISMGLLTFIAVLTPRRPGFSNFHPTVPSGRGTILGIFQGQLTANLIEALMPLMVMVVLWVLTWLVGLRKRGATNQTGKITGGLPA